MPSKQPSCHQACQKNRWWSHQRQGRWLHDHQLTAFKSVERHFCCCQGIEYDPCTILCSGKLFVAMWPDCLEVCRLSWVQLRPMCNQTLVLLQLWWSLKHCGLKTVLNGMLMQSLHCRTHQTLSLSWRWGFSLGGCKNVVDHQCIWNISQKLLLVVQKRQKQAKHSSLIWILHCWSFDYISCNTSGHISIFKHWQLLCHGVLQLYRQSHACNLYFTLFAK